MAFGLGRWPPLLILVDHGKIKYMNRNSLLYNAAAALTECARFVRPVDKDFVQTMLDKAQELADQITVDEQLEKEVNQFEESIRKGLTE